MKNNSIITTWVKGTTPDPSLSDRLFTEGRNLYRSRKTNILYFQGDGAIETDKPLPPFFDLTRWDEAPDLSNNIFIVYTPHK